MQSHAAKPWQAAGVAHRDLWQAGTLTNTNDSEPQAKLFASRWTAGAGSSSSLLAQIAELPPEPDGQLRPCGQYGAAPANPVGPPSWSHDNHPDRDSRLAPRSARTSPIDPAASEQRPRPCYTPRGSKNPATPALPAADADRRQQQCAAIGSEPPVHSPSSSDRSEPRPRQRRALRRGRRQRCQNSSWKPQPR